MIPCGSPARSVTGNRGPAPCFPSAPPHDAGRERLVECQVLNHQLRPRQLRPILRPSIHPPIQTPNRHPIPMSKPHAGVSKKVGLPGHKLRRSAQRSPSATFLATIGCYLLALSCSQSAIRMVEQFLQPEPTKMSKPNVKEWMKPACSRTDRSANGTSASDGRAGRITRSYLRSWSGRMRPDRGGAAELPIHAQVRIFLVGSSRP